MNERISASLARLFEEHRIIFWYDAAREWRPAFEAAELPGVTKCEIANNEFGLKHRMLRLEREGRFLLYKEGPEPPMAENWLLDLQLATTVFKADQAAIWLTELGLPLQFEEVVREHMDFYRARTRVEALKRLMRPEDSQARLRLRMLAVCVGADGGLDTVVEALLAELAEGRDDGFRLMERSGLLDFFWKQMAGAYGYQSDAPGVEDFALTLFQAAYRLSLGEAARLNEAALQMFRRWKNDRTGARSFEILAGKYQDPLGIGADLARREVRHLLDIDCFEEIDRHIIRQIVQALSAQTVPAAEALKWLRSRRQSHWYEGYQDIYLAIQFAVEFQQALAEANLTMASVAEGVSRYVKSWHKLDQLYRKFIHSMQKSAQPTLLSALFEAVENRYTTNYLLALNDAWQDQVNRLTDWTIPGFIRQMDFYTEQVGEFRRKDQKVVVIISDALRYEVADECLARIRGLDRFDAELTPMIGALPSYTQLGMAALLPNKSLQIAADGSALVLDGEESTQGLLAREKQLDTGRAGDRVRALKADEVQSMRVDDAKALFRDHDVVYIYQNRIDAVGDKRDTEEYLPEAVEDAITDLVTLVRKLASANFSNILVTADHGFLYQHRPIEEADFSIADPQGEDIQVRSRRFVIGRGLAQTPGMKKFSAGQLGLAGDLDVLIPNSIKRLRVKGAGSRFVHGGASLQEIVVPVLRVGKRREADLRQVEVEIIVPGKNIITSGQIAVTFYQKAPVSAKVQARELIAGIYAANGVLISDEHRLTFDFRSDNAREREMPRKFLLSRTADGFNNQDVFLKLRERVGKTTHFNDYASLSLQLRRGVTTDFDF